MSGVRDPSMCGGDSLEFPRTIRRHWRLAAMIAIGLPLLAGGAVSREAPVYSATGTLLYAPVDFNSKLLRGVVETSRVTDTLMASQAAVIRSTTMIGQLIARFDLAARPEFNPNLGRASFWRRWWPKTLRPAAPASHGVVAAAVRAALRVRVPEGTQLIEVSFRSTDPGLAARAANLAMRLYLERQRAANLAILDHAQAWLSRRAKATARALEATDIAIAKARAASGTERGVSATLTNQAAGRLTDALVVAETRLTAAKARMRREMDGTAAAAAASVASNVAPMRAREAELVAKLSALSAAEGPNYPDVRAARRALAALRGQIGAETGRLVAADRARMTADATRVAALKAALASARGRAASESILAAPVASLEEQRAAQRSLLRAQTEQIGALESQSALARPDARILSPAPVPMRPSAPRFGMLVVGAAILGLCLGVLAALAAEALNVSFRSGGEVSSAFDIPCVALIPEVNRRERRGLSVPDYVRVNPFSSFTEQMRALRTSLWLDPRAPKSLAVTAARPGEGKTTLALSLAVLLADSGMRVLAIDCDIRQPSFDAAFELGGAPGLTDCLSGRVSVEAAIQADQAPMLDVMTAGAVATDALSLFMSARMPELIAALRDRYDLVILDLPPVFALAEARVLARQADATLLCIRWGETPRRVVAASLALLDRAGIRIAGAVLTRVDSTRHARAGFADSELYHPRYGGYFRS
ncbi:polysaccharide biosynthesis tyrosine autokinase [Acidiphilium sp. AL]|nr:polysaccharide biosynthesis tyrosine autokinase [Acidiphilium sp. AL]